MSFLAVSEEVVTGIHGHQVRHEIITRAQVALEKSQKEKMEDPVCFW